MICYFFSDGNYIRVTRGETGPGTVDAGYPAPVVNWNFGKFGENGIDAALYSGTKCFFFAGPWYICVTRGGTGPGSIDAGFPRPISDWNWGKFGEKGIDAALYSGLKCYFFSGASYIRVTRADVGLGTIDPGYPAPIKNWNWGGFGDTGIDAALYSGGKCYFFSGDRYIRVSRGETGPGSVDADYPKPISIWNWGADFGADGIETALFSGMDDPTTTYPSTFPLADPIQETLADVAANGAACTSLYLDTKQNMYGRSGDNGVNHAQGLARTHLLSTNSVWFFLTYSEIGAHGTISSYQYTGPLQGAHIAEQDPKHDPGAVAPMMQIINVPNDHPCDIVFLQDVNNADAGYLFVAQQNVKDQTDPPGVGIFGWTNGVLNQLGFIPIPAFAVGENTPNFVMLDKVGDYYYLGVAWGSVGLLFRAETLRLFPSSNIGLMDVTAFVPAPDWAISPDNKPDVAPNAFSFSNVNVDASQVKLVRDSTDQWYLLGFRGDPDYTDGTDYVDVYPVKFGPFEILPRYDNPVHVTLAHGPTGFANNGTHYVDSLGRLLILSSYRWAEDDLSGGAGYVSRVDELSSS